MATSTTAVKVGVLVLLGLVALFVFLSFISGVGTGGEGTAYWAEFRDASGLAPKTQVRVAGIPVGEIADIELRAGRARVHFTVRADVPLYPDAQLAKRSESILGDYLLDLNPGAPPGEPLAPGSEVKDVKEALAIEQLLESVSGITADVKEVTAALRESLGGESGSVKRIVEDLERVSSSLEGAIARSSQQLERILSDAESISSDVRRLTDGKSGDVSEIITNIRVITEQTRGVMSSVQGIVGSNESDLKASVGGIRDALASVNRSLERIENVTQKIERGEGTLGKLVADEALGQKVEAAIEDASDFVSRVVQIQTEVTLRSELLLQENSAKNYLTLRVIPRPDKYYLFEIIDDPRGLVERETVVRSPPGAEEAARQEIRTTRDQLKFSAQFAKRYFFTTFRFGLIESTGGLGLNLHFLDDHLELKLDAFEFANPEKDYPRLKGYLNVLFLSHLFVTGGIDDVINPSDVEATTGRILSGRDYFLGGGIYFTDEDLKVLLTSIPLP